MGGGRRGGGKEALVLGQIQSHLSSCIHRIRRYLTDIIHMVDYVTTNCFPTSLKAISWSSNMGRCGSLTTMFLGFHVIYISVLRSMSTPMP